MVEGAPNTEKFSKGKLLVAPGFGESPKKAFKYINDELAELGYKTASHELTRLKNKRKLTKDLEEVRAQFPVLANLPLIIYQEARAFIEHAKDNPDAIKAIGHSYGGLYLVVAAVLEPKRFNKLILINPAGFTGKVEAHESKSISASEKVQEDRVSKLEAQSDNERWKEQTANYFTEVFKSFSLSLSNKDTRKRMFTAFVDGFSYIVDRLLWFGQVFDEGKAMANTDIVPFIKELQKNDIEISVIYDDSDIIFPANKLEKRIPEGVEKIPTSGKGHFGPVKEPESMANIIDDILAPKVNVPRVA